jgi:hypothetical protein
MVRNYNNFLLLLVFLTSLAFCSELDEIYLKLNKTQLDPWQSNKG